MNINNIWRIIMTIKLMSVSVILSIIVSGCMTFESPDQKYVLTKEGFKEVEKTSTTSSSDTSQTASAHPRQLSKMNADAARGYCNKYGRGRDPNPWSSIEFVVAKDIDVVYPKIMQEFGYTRWEAPLHYGTSLPICDVSLRYEEVPGSHYQMRRYIEHVHGKEEPKNTIEVDLSKEGVDKVRVRVSYYSGNTIDKAGYEASLKSRIEQALR
jgi:hypothetical protein